MENNILELPELIIQKSVHKIIADPSRVWQTVSGKRLQILSPGRINPNEGPDFGETAILLNGMIIVGDCEYHKNASDWFAHGHHTDPEYETVIIHIVSRLTSPERFDHELLLISDEDIAEAIKRKSADVGKQDLRSLEELQQFALIRLLRKSMDAQKLINLYGFESAYNRFACDFISRYNSKRRRPVYSTIQLADLMKNIDRIPAFYFLREISNGVNIEINERMTFLLKQKGYNEGSHLRRELLINCILPMALCLADEEARINLLLWFWSVPALNKYGILNRRFEDISQDYLWQQQGMLEYIKEKGRTGNLVAEAFRKYGFSEVLSFYRFGFH